MNNSGVLNQPPFQSNASYPSPSSQQQSSPHLQVHRNISSPHQAFSPSSPNSTSTLHHQPQPKSQLPLPPNAQQQNLNTNMGQSAMQNQNWSNLPPNMNNSQMQMRPGGPAIGMNNGNAGQVKLMQELNPILNAQLSQESISYVQMQPSHSQSAANPQQASLNSPLNSSNQSLPPSSNSPSLNSGLSMRFSRNSPVLTSNNQHLANSQQAQQPQYPSSPGFMSSNMNNVHSPTQPMNRNPQMQPTTGQQRLQPMQQHRMNVGQPAQQTYYPSSDNLVSSNQMQQQQQPTGQQVVYSNCGMNSSNMSGGNMNSNMNSSNMTSNMTGNMNSNMSTQQSPNNMASGLASSEMVKQGLRAKLGARSHQQMNSNAGNSAQTMPPSRGQMPMMQQQQASPMQHMAHAGHLQSNSSAGSVHHLQMQQSNSSNMSSNIQQNSQSQQPMMNMQTGYGSTSAQLSSSQQHSPQQLTDEDFDAIGLALSVNNDSSFFSFNDLPEANTMVGGF